MKIANKCICCNSTALNKTAAVLSPFLSDIIFDWKLTKITTDWNIYGIEYGMLYTRCNTIQCSKCGIIFLDMRFDDEEMFKLYKDYLSGSYLETREIYEPGFIQKFVKYEYGATKYLYQEETYLSKYLKFPIGILDYGGNNGIDTPFKDNNKFFHIYDIGNNAVPDNVKKVDLYEAKHTAYDLVVCKGVLEHVSYPLVTLANIRECMSKNTLLFICIPYESTQYNYDLLEMKRFWHEHINFYSEESLRILLKNSGYNIIDKIFIEMENTTTSTGFARMMYIIAKLTEEI
jgi:hypothetical protein